MYDLIICGGGTAGCAVAISASERGLHCLLCEQSGELGGIITAGCIGYIMDAKEKKGIVEQLRESDCAVSKGGSFMVNTETMKYYLEDRLIKAGVELRYFTKLIQVHKENDRISSVVLSQKSDIVKEQARIYVDCTGDGELGYLSGCTYSISEPSELQPASFHALVTGIKYEEVKDCVFNNPEIYSEDAKANLLLEFKRAGFVPTYLCPTLGRLESGLFTYGINHQYLENLSVKELTQATIMGRREVFESVRALRSLGGKWSNITVANTPGMIGIREGRRIKGVKTVTKEDLINGNKAENSMCRVTLNVDIHGKTGYHDGGIKTKPYDIPLEAMTASDISNLYMAGRCISGDRFAHASYRVSGNTLTMGQNLGIYLAEKLRKSE